MPDSAECVIRTFVHGDGPTARASLQQVKRAAAALSLECAAGGQSQGGIVTNIGQSHRDCVKGETRVWAICLVLIEIEAEYNPQVATITSPSFSVRMSRTSAVVESTHSEMHRAVEPSWRKCRPRQETGGSVLRTYQVFKSRFLSCSARVR